MLGLAFGIRRPAIPMSLFGVRGSAAVVRGQLLAVRKWGGWWCEVSRSAFGIGWRRLPGSPRGVRGATETGGGRLTGVRGREEAREGEAPTVRDAKTGGAQYVGRRSGPDVTSGKLPNQRSESDGIKDRRLGRRSGSKRTSTPVIYPPFGVRRHQATGATASVRSRPALEFRSIGRRSEPADTRV